MEFAASSDSIVSQRGLLGEEEKKMWSETQMDLREYQLNVGLIRTA
jgi:hypothetical protein